MTGNRKYVIIPQSEAHLVDFSQVMETSIHTLRFSVDGTKTFVKYEGEMPESVLAVEGRSEEYNHGEILAILQSEEWTDTDTMMEE